MDRVPCKKCGVKVLPSTIDKTGGYCMPCFKGPDQRTVLQRCEDKAVRMGLMKDSDRVAHLQVSETKRLKLLDELLPLGQTYKEVLGRCEKAEPHQILSNLSAIIMYKEQDAGLSSLNLAERHVYVIDGMITEVNNGGFDQFFFNSTGELAYELIPALTEVGSVQFKDIASRAIDIFGKLPSLDEDSRYAHLENITHDGELQLWEACDDEFYECEEQLEELVVRYARHSLD